MRTVVRIQKLLEPAYRGIVPPSEWAQATELELVAFQKMLGDPTTRLLGSDQNGTREWVSEGNVWLDIGPDWDRGAFEREDDPCLIENAQHLVTFGIAECHVPAATLDGAPPRELFEICERFCECRETSFEPIGVARIVDGDGDWCIVRAVGVMPSHRDKGVARAVLADAKVRAMEKNLCGVWAFSCGEQRAWNQSLRRSGFELVSVEPLGSGWPEHRWHWQWISPEVDGDRARQTLFPLGDE